MTARVKPLVATATVCLPLLATAVAFACPAAIATPARGPSFGPSPAIPLAPFAVQDSDSPKGVFKTSYFGFQFKHPKKWVNVPMKTKEQWLAAKYRSKTSFSFTDKELGYTYSHKPELQVIVFPHAVMQKEGVDEEESEVDGEKVITIQITSPYRDYDDFLSRTFKGGGYYLSSEKEDVIDDTKVTKYVYTVDKMARSGPQTIETWVYHAEGVDYAVQLVGLTKHWKKIQKLCKPVRQTFKLIERSGSLDHSGATSGAIVFSRVNLKDTTPEEQRSRAVASESSIHEAAIAKLPPEGWGSKKTDRALLISSANKRLNKRLQKHVDNMFNWLDKEYGFLGENRYMRAPVIRVCSSMDEAASFTAGVESGGYGGSWRLGDELLTWNDTSGWTGYAIDRLNGQIYQYWMNEKNFELATALPIWIDQGLGALIRNSRMDSRKIDWRFQNYTVERFRNLVRDGSATPVKEMFLQTTSDFIDATKDGDPWAESAMLMNYLASPGVKRCSLAKGLLKTYLTNMMSVVEGISEDSEKALDEARKKAVGEGDDKEYGKARREIFKTKERQILKKTFELTFGDWDDADWNKLQKDFYGAF